jgi:hypothetical protein
MKKNILFCSALLLALSGCNKPKERAAIMNKDVDGKVFAVSELGELTGSAKTVIIKSASKDSIKAMDDKLKIATTDGKIGDLLKKVKAENTKGALDDQLAKGAIALVVLKDQVKIFKVVSVVAPTDPAKQDPPPDQTPAIPPKQDPPPDLPPKQDPPADPANPAQPPANPPADPAQPVTPPTPPPAIALPAEESLDSNLESAAAPQQLLTFNYLSRLKAQSKMSDATAQQAAQNDLDAAKLQTPEQAGEKYGFEEITSLCVDKVGILDNERTDYGEKKSTLNVIEGPFDMATHILVGDEPTADKPCGSPAKKADSTDE